MNYTVKYGIKYPQNKDVCIEDIAMFSQACEAIKYAKQQAKDRAKYDNKTPFEYAVINTQTGEISNRYYLGTTKIF